MAVIPLKLGTLGLIAALSRTVLAIASLGLIDTDAEPEPEPPPPGHTWLLGMALQDQRVQLDPMKVAIYAAGAGFVC
jgi:hypothetical protein